MTEKQAPTDRIGDADRTAALTAALGGRYVIERELGQGGMATVYVADDVRHRRKVAIKVLKPELAAVLGGESVASPHAIVEWIDQRNPIRPDLAQA